jgi:hypothetical protein
MTDIGDITATLKLTERDLKIGKLPARRRRDELPPSETELTELFDGFLVCTDRDSVMPFF